MHVTALLCLLFVCVASTVQACHVHGERVPLKQDSHHNAPQPDDHCPLCVAMHSALPATEQVAPEPVLQMVSLDLIASDTFRVFRWSFELASRPPPTLRIAPTYTAQA